MLSKYVEADGLDSPGTQVLTFSAMALTIPDRCALMPLDCSQYQNLSQCSTESTFKNNHGKKSMKCQIGSCMSSVAMGIPLRSGTQHTERMPPTLVELPSRFPHELHRKREFPNFLRQIYANQPVSSTPQVPGTHPCIYPSVLSKTREKQNGKNACHPKVCLKWKIK